MCLVVAWNGLHLQKVSPLKVYDGNKPDFKNVRGCATGRKKNHKLEKKKQGLIATLKIKNAKLTTTCTCKREKIRAL